VTDQAIDLPTEESDSELLPAATGRNRFVDRFDPKVVNALTIVGFVVPVVVYFWTLHRYSLNVIVGDQWADLVVIGHSYTHGFDWSSLWAQHNENRILFPNLIVLLLAYTTHFNIQVEEYLSATLLVGSTVLIIWAHKRRSPSAPWLYYCPVALLAFSIVQYQNALWGFQMAWYLVVFSLAAAVVLLDRPSLTWIYFIGSITAGIVGSFSSLGGLLIWPAGVVLLYHRRRRSAYVRIWIASAIAALILYFVNFNPNTTPEHSFIWHHPVAAVKFYLFALGDVVGLADMTHSESGWGNPAVLLLGLVILVLAVAVLQVYGMRREETGGGPIGVALICVGLLFAAITTYGRAVFGYYGASFSRYTTFDLLIPIGIYLALLGQPTMAWRRSTADRHRDGLPASEHRVTWRVRHWMGNHALRVARWAIAIVIVVQVAFGLHYGNAGARTIYADDVTAARVLRNINHESDGQIVYRLYIVGPASFVRKQAHLAQAHHLSLFSSP
jgi:hypothetical protein